MTPDTRRGLRTPLQAIHRLALLLSAAALGFAVLFSVQAWRSARADELRELNSVLTLITRSVDAYFLQGEAQLRLLAEQLREGPGLADLARAQQLLARVRMAHPKVAAINLIDLDGRFLATSSTTRLEGLPSVAAESSFRAFAEAFRRDHGLRPSLSRPVRAVVLDGWLFALRAGVLDAQGRPVAVLSWVLPVDVLRDFWRDTPVIEKASVGLLGDDGYLLSRFPVPARVDPAEMYGQPRAGALRRHLVEHGFPASGFVQGPNLLGGADFANVYQRLPNFPVTAFVAEPVSEFQAAWWARVRVPFALLVALLLSTLLAWRYTAQRQRAWDAERARADEALVVSEREQRFLIDHLIAGVAVHGAQGELLRVNPRACQLLGLDEAQLAGRAAVDPRWHLVREDGSELPPEDTPLARVLGCGQAVIAHVIGVVEPGRSEPRWLLARADPEFDESGTLRQVVATFVDVTEQRRAERRFRTLFEHNLDGVLQTRPDGRILAANPAACALFGRSEAELQGLGRRALVDTDDARMEALLQERERNGRAQGRVRLRRGDGTAFEAEASTVAYTDEHGESLTTVVLRDVSDRQRAEEARAAQQVAERANRAKSEFVARMSHELRTPLNAILGFAEVLGADPRDPLTPPQRERVGRVRQAGEHLLALINDVLDLSRVEAGQLHVERAAFELQAQVESVLREMASFAQRHGVALSLDAPAEPLPAALGDRVRMRQVLLNLVSNAIKYNRPGGTVTVRLRRRGERLSAEVCDTGPGLTTQQLRALFQPFNRLGREGGAVEGTGIGLVIARGLLELMGGSVEVDSTPGRGSCFRVWIGTAPALAPTDDTPAVAPVTAPQALAGEVLYVDDDEVNRMLMQAFFGLLPGLRLRLAADGPQGLALARERPPDAVLVDMMMPVMDGPAFLRALRDDPALAHTTCVAVSANAMPAEIQAALAAGFDGYLTKPLSLPALAQALAEAGLHAAA